MLQRAIYISDAVGTAGSSLLSIAQILGASDVNNRRDHLTGVLVHHRGQFMQVIEGARVDLDRLLARLRQDPRHTNLRILADGPAGQRRFGSHPLAKADVDGDIRKIIGDRALDALTLPQVEAVFLSAVSIMGLAA